MTFIEILVTGLAVASITMTISQSNVMEYPRTLISKLGLGKLINCAYCLSHWIGFGIVWMRQDFFPLINFVLTSFAVITVASLASLGIAKLFLALDDLGEIE
jgi:Protein of unknown function (DUF1360)